MSSPVSEHTDKERQRTLTQYVAEGNRFRPAGPVRLLPALPPLAYEAMQDMNGPFFEKFVPRTDSLLRFTDSTMESVLSEVDRFWELKDNFTELGFMHNRGILLHGPPGTGKTSLIHQVTEQMIERGDVVFHGKSVYTIKNCLDAFRQVEEERRTVVVLEDMDEYIGHQERDMLQLLDGANATDNVLYLGCLTPDHRLLTRDLRWVPCGELQAGDELWTLDEDLQEADTARGSCRRYRPGKVVSAFRAKKECVRVRFESGEEITCTTDHPFLAKAHKSDTYKWVAAEDLLGTPLTLRPFDTWEAEDSYDAGWLAGMLELLGRIRPSRLIGNFDIEGGVVQPHPGMDEKSCKVVAVERIGEQEIVSLETDTHTYFGEGFAMHNTTNYVQRFPERLLRPGRFDHLVEVFYPPYQGRLAYLMSKLSRVESEEVIEQLAEKTDGMSFGHLRELVIAAYAFKEDVDKVLRRLSNTNPAKLPLRCESAETYLHGKEKASALLTESARPGYKIQLSLRSESLRERWIEEGRDDYEEGVEDGKEAAERLSPAGKRKAQRNATAESKNYARMGDKELADYWSGYAEGCR